MTDPIADMLNRIRNAQAIGKESVEVPYSRMKFEIGKILERTGFVKKTEPKAKRGAKTIEIQLAYEAGESRIRGVKRISKPGQRLYSSVVNLSKNTGRRQGIVIMTTSKGLMSAGEAKKQGLGGEIVCEVWG